MKEYADAEPARMFAPIYARSMLSEMPLRKSSMERTRLFPWLSLSIFARAVASELNVIDQLLLAERVSR